MSPTFPHTPSRRSDTRTPTTGYVVSTADRDRAEDTRQRLVLVGMDPDDTRLLDERDEMDRRDRLEDMGSTNGWSRS